MCPFGMHHHDTSCFMYTIPLFHFVRFYAYHACWCHCWFSMHLCMLASMFMHESCMLVCRPCFNTMKLWTFDPNLHLLTMDTTFCLPFYLFAFLLVYLLLVSLLTMFIMLICFMPFSHALCISFFPLLVCWFLVLVFACTHMERGRIEVGHGLSGASKKGEDASLSI